MQSPAAGGSIGCAEQGLQDGLTGAMLTHMHRSKLIAAALAVLLLVGLWLWWNARPEAQAKATFARLAGAVAAKTPGELLDQVHPDYSFSALWPQQVGEAGAALGDSNGAQRELVRRALIYLFQSRRDQAFVMSWKVLSVTPEANGDIAAKVDLAVSAGNDSLLGDSLTGHRFVLRRTSFLGRLEIIGHDPFVIRH